MSGVIAVIFDMDGVLVDTEPVWSEAKHELVTEAGGHWSPDAPVAMLGMSGPEWAQYLHDDLGVPLGPEEIRQRVVDGVLRRLESSVPVIPGVPEAVASIAARWPLAVASSADRPVIEAALAHAGIRDRFDAIVASDEAGAGKPAPDVYLAAASRLGVAPTAAVAVEDSPNGIRSASAAGMGVVAIPNPHAPMDASALALADVVLDTIERLTPAVVEQAGRS
jgi:HAD superfamily hydrolase (TIGR01509 family)